MLPTIAPKPVGIWERDRADSNSNHADAAPAETPPRPDGQDRGPAAVPVLPCQHPDGPSWTDWAQRKAAAQLCDRCPVAHACLLEALRVDGAARRGEDPYGVRGVWGGVWFQPKLRGRPHGLPDSVLHPIHRRLANRPGARAQA